MPYLLRCFPDKHEMLGISCAARAVRDIWRCGGAAIAAAIDEKIVLFDAKLASVGFAAPLLNSYAIVLLRAETTKGSTTFAAFCRSRDPTGEPMLLLIFLQRLQPACSTHLHSWQDNGNCNIYMSI